MKITLAMLRAVAPGSPTPMLEALAAPLTAACARWGIDTPKRVAAFLSQCAHESAGFTRRSENLNYSAERLMAVWPKRFPTIAAAQPYARNPEKLANRVYGGRMMNGPEASGDGWRYRGRGFKQLTGKANYLEFATAIGMPLADVPAYLETDEGACQSAAWFWARHKLNPLADVGNVEAITLKINGGRIGLVERQRLFAKACAACGVPA